ncbi:MAG: hypothetical protein WCL32_24540 [Planctomycetota bacterium]
MNTIHEAIQAATQGAEQTVTFKVNSPLQRLLLEQALVMAQELEAATAAAPWGQVARLAEAEAVARGRALTCFALEQVLQQAVAAQEKKTTSAPARAARADGTRAPMRVGK